jgi:hypothetical protein
MVSLVMVSITSFSSNGFIGSVSITSFGSNGFTGKGFIGSGFCN